MIKPLLTTFAWSRWLSGYWSFSFSSGFLFLFLALLWTFQLKAMPKKKKKLAHILSSWPNIRADLVTHVLFAVHPLLLFFTTCPNSNQWIVSQTNSLSVPGWVWTTLYFSYLLLLENACLCCQRSSRFLRYSENSWQFGQGKSLTAWEAYDHICCFLKTPIKG